MQVHPDISALRSDAALQRQANDTMSAAFSDWKESEGYARIASDLKAYDQGRALADCADLGRMLANVEAADAFVASWRDALLAALRTQPLGNVPSRHSISKGLTTIQLTVAGNATLSLLAYEERSDLAEPQSAMFVDRELHEMVLAGGATGMRHTLSQEQGGQAQVASHNFEYQWGSTASFAPCTDARQFTRVAGSMLVLQLSRTPARPAPSALYSLDNGTLLQRTSGNKRASQNFLALDVLGAMGRTDAVLAMIELASSHSEEPELRWEAVRQVLGLDAAQGMTLLGQLSARDTDPLAAPAQSLQQSLVQADAQLAQFAKENARCPA